LFLEHLENGDLFHYIRRERLSKKAIVFVAAEVLEGLRFLHTNSFLYRDLKPENIMIGDDGHIRLIDFGLSKRVKIGERTYTVVGSPDYVAPEVLSKVGYGREADYWSFGVFLYELIVGKPPFKADSTYETYSRIKSGDCNLNVISDPVSRDLIRGLLTANPSTRLTLSQAKTHEFFAGVNWNDMNQWTPPAWTDVNEFPAGFSEEAPLFDS
jgi:serine/threonine protein kinase